MLGLPPDTVPENLEASEYFSLAKWYKELEWLDLARQSLEKCIQLAGEQPLGRDARNFLSSKVPRYPIPADAVKRLLDASRNPRNPELVSVCDELIAAYPNFEWPYKILADRKLTEGNVDEAKRLLHQSLAINPDHGKSVGQMGVVLAIEMNYVAALPHLRRATELLPDDEEIAAFLRTVQSIMTWDTWETKPAGQTDPEAPDVV